MSFSPLFHRLFLIFVCQIFHFVHNLYQLYHTLLQLTYKCHCPTFREMTFQLFQSLVVILCKQSVQRPSGYLPYETEHGNRSARHNIHADSCRMSPHEMALQRFAPWWKRTCLSCQNGQTSLESAYLLHYWSSLNSGLLPDPIWDCMTTFRRTVPLSSCSGKRTSSSDWGWCVPW